MSAGHPGGSWYITRPNITRTRADRERKNKKGRETGEWETLSWKWGQTR